mmetsp:Transcript_39805/g.80246  ORF Transcript_39805/g.80246 Transcript_39805/m.80246 type:complete len:202 (-) Transcript_39805:579-1184(-)
MRPSAPLQPSSLDRTDASSQDLHSLAMLRRRYVCSFSQPWLPIPTCLRLSARKDGPPDTRKPTAEHASIPSRKKLCGMARRDSARVTTASHTRWLSAVEMYMALPSAVATATSVLLRQEMKGPATLMMATALPLLHSVHVPSTSHSSKRLPLAREYSWLSSLNSEQSFVAHVRAIRRRLALRIHLCVSPLWCRPAVTREGP